MERGEVNPSLELLIRLMKVLEVSPNELFVFATPLKSKRIDFSSLKPADLKIIKQTLSILRSLFR
jgi:transcriptional regulator with XRE-family HTH domain